MTPPEPIQHQIHTHIQAALLHGDVAKLSEYSVNAAWAPGGQMHAVQGSSIHTSVGK